MFGHRRLTKTTTLASGALGLATVTLLAACGGQSTSAGPPAGNGQASAVVQVGTVSGRHVLVDRQGHTLYTADQEKSGHIQCTGGCLQFWFPVTAKGGTPTTNQVPAGRLGTVHRTATGAAQVTFDGKPLYTFKLDTSAGTAKGDGFSDQFGGTAFDWHAAALGATGSGAASGAGNNQGGGGGGYSY
jgi:predicted lipoprotein with Yx(FWY)xxD motif